MGCNRVPACRHPLRDLWQPARGQPQVQARLPFPGRHLPAPHLWRRPCPIHSSKFQVCTCGTCLLVKVASQTSQRPQMDVQLAVEVSKSHAPLRSSFAADPVHASCAPCILPVRLQGCMTRGHLTLLFLTCVIRAVCCCAFQCYCALLPVKLWLVLKALSIYAGIALVFPFPLLFPEQVVAHVCSTHTHR